MQRRGFLSATAAALTVPLVAGCTRDDGGDGGGGGGTTDGGDDGSTTTEGGGGGGGPYGRIDAGAGDGVAIGPEASPPVGGP